jgi:hypothetical protein
MIHKRDGEADWLIVLWNKVKIVLDYGVRSTIVCDKPILKKKLAQGIGL